MLRSAVKAFVGFVLCVVLTSCWDEVMIQDLSYITATGIDYDRDSKKYELFAHIIDVTRVAKQDSGGGSGSTSKNISFVGRAEGDSPFLALQNLYHSMQMEPNIDHLITIVVSESALPHLKDIIDAFNRSRAVRYTVRLLATASPIEELFKMSEQVGKSPLNTNVYQPDSNTRSQPFAYKWDLQKMVREYAKSVNVTFIPKIDEVPNKWQPHKLEREPVYNGAFVLAGQQYKGSFTEEELSGVRWFRGTMRNIVIPLHRGDEFIGAVHVKKAKPRMKMSSASGGSYRLRLSVDLAMDELLKTMTVEEAEKAATASIREQIERSRQLAVSRKVDLFGLEEYAFRYHNRLWKKLKAEGTRFETLPMKTEIRVRLINTGKMKMLEG